MQSKYPIHKTQNILVYNPRKETYEEFLKRVAKYEESVAHESIKYYNQKRECEKQQSWCAYPNCNCPPFEVDAETKALKNLADK